MNEVATLLMQARTALTQQDDAGLRATFIRLFALTEPAKDAATLLAWAQARCIAASLALRQGIWGAALMLIGNACDCIDMLGDRPEAFDLALDILALPKTWVPTGMDSALWKTFSGQLEELIRRCGGDPVPDPDISEPFLLVIAHIDALPLGMPLPLRVLLASALIMIGGAASEAGEQGRAIVVYETCRRLIEMMDERVALILGLELYQSLAMERQRGGDFEGMRDAFGQMEVLVQRLPQLDAETRVEMPRLERLGERLLLATQAGDWKEAAAVAREQLEYFAAKGMRPPPEVEKGLLCLADERPDDVFRALDGADVAGLPFEGFREILDAHELMENGQTLDAIRLLLGLTMRIDRKCSLPARWRAELQLSQIHDAQSSLAVLFAKMAVRTIEKARLEVAAQRVEEVTILNDMGADEAYKSARNLLVRHGRLGEALRVESLLEQADARIPVPRLSHIASVVDARIGLTELEKVAVRELTRIAAGWEANYTPKNWFTRKLHPTWAAEMAAVEQRLGHKTGMAATDNSTAELSALDHGVGVLRVHSFDGDMFVEMVCRDGGRAVTMPGSEDALRNAVYAAMRALQSRSEDAETCCRTLHDLILAPLDLEIPNVLVVQASGALRRIPFGVLFDGKEYLIERCAVVTHPGTQVVDVSRGIQKSVRSLSVAVSNSPGLAPLPYARKDSEIIGRAVGAEAIGLFDSEVTLAALDAIFKLRPVLLHVSSHFETDAVDSGRSGFILWDGSRYELSRLAKLDLSSVDLALILGCETLALADAAGTAGIFGLDELLLRLGVGSVVGTAWRVRDFVAHAFLAEFVNQVFRLGADQAQALRAATLKVARATGTMGHPHDWGAYQLIGGWRGLVS